MNTRRIQWWGIAALVALLGLTGVQAWWIWRGVQHARETWENNLRNALATTAFRLEAGNIAGMVEGKNVFIFSDETISIALDSVNPNLLPPPPPPGPPPGQTKRRMEISWHNEGAAATPSPKRIVLMANASGDTKQLGDTALQLTLQHRVEQVTRQIAAERLRRGGTPDTTGLDSVYRAEMRLKGISPIPAYWLAPMPEQHKTPVFARLFPSDLISRPTFLHADARTGANAWIIRSIGGLMALSVVFTLIIGLMFATGIRMLLKQKRLSDTKQDFINNMTHELKTPLATISLAATSLDLPQVHADEARARQYTRIIREENSRINRLVEMVLTMARVDKHSLELNRSRVDLRLLLQAECDAFDLHASSRGGKVVFAPAPDSHVLNGDPDMLKAVFSNLLDNALKYSPEVPDIEVQTVVSAVHGKQLLHVRVSDNGAGIPASEQEHIFERFYRVGSTRDHSVKGFGLGLSFAREVVDAHSGSLRVLHSAPGQGTTFECTLPL